MVRRRMHASHRMAAHRVPPEWVAAIHRVRAHAVAVHHVVHLLIHHHFRVVQLHLPLGLELSMVLSLELALIRLAESVAGIHAVGAEALMRLHLGVVSRREIVIRRSGGV